jgi:hypothetical protein
MLVFLYFARSMATISEEQRMKFLMKARAKKAQPEDKVDVLSKLEIVEGDKKKKSGSRGYSHGDPQQRIWLRRCCGC